MNSNIETIGKFIAFLRKEKGYTQKELAKELNTTDKTISSWENDNTIPDIYTIPLIAKIFNISCDELINCKRITTDDNQVNVVKKPRHIVYKSLIIGLSVILVFTLAIFWYMVDTYSLGGYDRFENVIIDNVVYKKNDDGKYSVVGLTKGSRDTNIVILEKVRGIEVTRIKANAFYDKRFQSCILSKNIRVIEAQAFFGCSVSEIVLNEGLIQIDKYAFANSYISELKIPSTVVFIGNGAFMNCESLNKISGGAGLVTIDSNAFYDCSRLQDVILEGYTSIKSQAFSKCADLRIVKLKHVIEIESHAFSKSFLYEIYLSKDVKTIGTTSFLNCYELKNIYYEGTKEEFAKFDIQFSTGVVVKENTEIK